MRSTQSDWSQSQNSPHPPMQSRLRADAESVNQTPTFKGKGEDFNQQHQVAPPPGQSIYEFRLSPSNQKAHFKFNVIHSFAPFLLPDGCSYASTIPYFNRDGAFDTPSFLCELYNDSLGLWKNRFYQVRNQQLGLTRQNMKSLEPDKESNWCNICSIRFQDYQSHITLTEHTHKAKISLGQRYLENMVAQFNKTKVQQSSDKLEQKRSKKVQRRQKKKSKKEKKKQKKQRKERKHKRERQNKMKNENKRNSENQSSESEEFAWGQNDAMRGQHQNQEEEQQENYSSTPFHPRHYSSSVFQIRMMKPSVEHEQAQQDEDEDYQQPQNYEHKIQQQFVKKQQEDSDQYQHQESPPRSNKSNFHGRQEKLVKKEEQDERQEENYSRQSQPKPKNQQQAVKEQQQDSDEYSDQSPPRLKYQIKQQNYVKKEQEEEQEEEEEEAAAEDDSGYYSPSRPRKHQREVNKVKQQQPIQAHECKQQYEQQNVQVGVNHDAHQEEQDYQENYKQRNSNSKSLSNQSRKNPKTNHKAQFQIFLEKMMKFAEQMQQHFERIRSFKFSFQKVSNKNQLEQQKEKNLEQRNDLRNEQVLKSESEKQQKQQKQQKKQKKENQEKMIINQYPRTMIKKQPEVHNQNEQEKSSIRDQNVQGDEGSEESS